MTKEKFEALVKNLERQAQARPEQYKVKVWLLAVLGNAYLAVMVLFIVALILSLAASVMYLRALAVKLILVVGVFLIMVLKALWIKMEPPIGNEIKAQEAPELFALIEDLRTRLTAPCFHHVMITDEFNAAVVQLPRLGIFGWHCNYLMIGLPLMKALTEDQFTAVLAHEMGHLSRGHGRMANWIYHQRQRWRQLMESLEETESRGRFLFKPFLNWFVPYFNAYSFPLARANEYEADATSAKLTSSRNAAETLTSVSVIADYLAERYWPSVHRLAEEQPQPGFAPFAGMAHGVSTQLDAASAKQWLDQAMSRQTDLADTHPALKDRLKAIGEPPHLLPPMEHRASDRLLGEALERITADLDQRWQEAVSPSWEERYREVQEDRHQLAELNLRMEKGEELALQEAYDRARLTESIAHNPDDALDQFRALHQRAPEDSMVCFALGVRLLEKNDEAGCDLVKHAMDLDSRAIVRGSELLRDYYWRLGNRELADKWHHHLMERYKVEQADEKERNQITLQDKFQPHGISEEGLSEIRRQLSSIEKLRRVYFLRKQVSHETGLPCFVLGFSIIGMFQLYRKDRVKKVLHQIQEMTCFPGDTLIICIDGPNYRFGRKFRRIKGARIL